ncbi:unnamed protein product, partial [Strongylus vulgaris]
MSFGRYDKTNLGHIFDRDAYSIHLLAERHCDSASFPCVPYNFTNPGHSRYFASIAGHRMISAGVENRVLATNPIMESIGNAKTIRNDNSSRFGKFIQINFDEKFLISGAEMKTYLLEKSRVVFQAPAERNYHIFYQLCAARDHPLIKDLELGTSESYWYTAQGGDGRVPAVDDREDFLETVKALDILGFNQEKQKDVYRVLKGILLLGNIEFESNGDNSTIA